MRRMSNLAWPYSLTIHLDALKDRNTQLKQELSEFKNQCTGTSGLSNTVGFDRYNNALGFIFRTDTSFLDDEEDVIEFLKTKHPQSRKTS